MRSRRLLGAVIVPLALLLPISLAAAPAASAAKIVHPKLSKPKKNAHKGKRVKFKVHDRSPIRPGNSPRTLWVIVAKHKKTNRFGELKHKNFRTSTFGSMKHSRKHKNLYTARIRFNRGGTYFWQAFRIDCSVHLPVKQDCHVTSKIRKLHIRR